MNLERIIVEGDSMPNAGEDASKESTGPDAHSNRAQAVPSDNGDCSDREYNGDDYARIDLSKSASGSGALDQARTVGTQSRHPQHFFTPQSVGSHEGTYPLEGYGPIVIVPRHVAASRINKWVGVSIWSAGSRSANFRNILRLMMNQLETDGLNCKGLYVSRGRHVAIVDAALSLWTFSMLPLFCHSPGFMADDLRRAF
jgi:hypothetical protein